MTVCLTRLKKEFNYAGISSPLMKCYLFDWLPSQTNPIFKKFLIPLRDGQITNCYVESYQMLSFFQITGNQPSIVGHRHFQDNSKSYSK